MPSTGAACVVRLDGESTPAARLWRAFAAYVEPQMKRIRFSLTSMFLVTTIVALVIALAYSRFEVAQLSKELNSIVPLREMEIIAQIERTTADAKMPVTVKSTMYTGNNYLIGFEYFDPKTGARTASSFILRFENNGRHVGAIRDDPFLSLEPDEFGERGLNITVIDPRFSQFAERHDRRKNVQAH